MSTISCVSAQNDLYERAVAEYGTALGRLARGYEADPEKRRDLLQEVHLALWRSFEGFDGRCSLRTWVYRVAHNVAGSWVIRQKRAGRDLVRADRVEAGALILRAIQAGVTEEQASAPGKSLASFKSEPYVGYPRIAADLASSCGARNRVFLNFLVALYDNLSLSDWSCASTIISSFDDVIRSRTRGLREAAVQSELGLVFSS